MQVFNTQSHKLGKHMAKGRVMLSDGNIEKWKEGNTIKMVKPSRKKVKQGSLKSVRDVENELYASQGGSDYLDDGRVGTSRIQVKGTFYKGKMFNSIWREFPDVQAASSYYAEMIRDDEEISRSKCYRAVSLKSRITLISNYSFLKIQQRIPVIGVLKDISDPREKPFITPSEATVASPTAAKKKQRSNGELIPLKVLCRDIGIEPRKARAVLRAAAKAGKMPHEWSGRWEFEANELPHIKTLLGVK